MSEIWTSTKLNEIGKAFFTPFVHFSVRLYFSALPPLPHTPPPLTLIRISGVYGLTPTALAAPDGSHGGPERSSSGSDGLFKPEWSDHYRPLRAPWRVQRVQRTAGATKGRWETRRETRRETRHGRLGAVVAVVVGVRRPFEGKITYRCDRRRATSAPEEMRAANATFKMRDANATFLQVDAEERSAGSKWPPGDSDWP